MLFETFKYHACGLAQAQPPVPRIGRRPPLDPAERRSDNEARSRSKPTVRRAAAALTSTLAMSFSTVRKPSLTEPPAQASSITEAAPLRLARHRAPGCIREELGRRRPSDGHLRRRANPRPATHHLATNRNPCDLPASVAGCTRMDHRGRHGTEKLAWSFRQGARGSFDAGSTP